LITEFEQENIFDLKKTIQIKFCVTLLQDLLLSVFALYRDEPGIQ
jgi:hypothetical protein